MAHIRKRSWSELDSFYDSKILIFLLNTKIARESLKILSEQGFCSVMLLDDPELFFEEATRRKHDLIIIDLKIQASGFEGYDVVRKIRENDVDVGLITVSANADDMHQKLEFSIHRHFRYPFLTDNLVKASKKALGDKMSYEIGMQFFDALFGMQMCTHRDLHQRTFDHVIRTTKIYAKFLLYLNRKGLVELTSWVLKNCLMASLVHDIGKLLVMHGVLYKDGKLSAFEYEQVRRHPWNSITALLGGHDINFFARDNGPIQTVSGYNDKNLGAQVQKWVLKIMNGDGSALADADAFFEELAAKPFIHSLNIDLLYIVLRHHDGLERSYFSDDELADFGKIMGREISPGLDGDSPLDIVTNALSICDMYDALLDTKRDYRRSSYGKSFALIMLYNEMKRKKFFPFVVDEFIRFVVETDMSEADGPLHDVGDPDAALAAVRSVSDTFDISKDQESDFNEFLVANSAAFAASAPRPGCPELLLLREEWIAFHDERRGRMMDAFVAELKRAKLVEKDISDFSADEKKTFDMLYQFYYSYSSSFKQKKLVEYLVHSVCRPTFSAEAKRRMIALLGSEAVSNRREFERLLFEEGYDRADLFAVFRDYSEDTLINELNDFLRRIGS